MLVLAEQDEFEQRMFFFQFFFITKNLKVQILLRYRFFIYVVKFTGYDDVGLIVVLYSVANKVMSISLDFLFKNKNAFLTVIFIFQRFLPAPCLAWAGYASVCRLSVRPSVWCDIDCIVIIYRLGYLEFYCTNN